MQVQPTGQAGVYTVSGRTNLPEQTRITVQAVRDLKAQPSSKLTNDFVKLGTADRSTYSILGRTQVNVKDGQWQTSLNLLQSVPDRQTPGTPGLLETWQVSKAQLGLQPNPRVIFLAVTDPVSQALTVEQGSPSAAQDNLSIRFTNDGKSYLQAEQALVIEPPNVKVSTQPPVSTIATVPVKSLDGSTELTKQSNAPLSTNAIAR
ncbi:hypothetical protein [Myxacorys almedinensis]|uniref:Uncharacterized protein n=1 Tax=Myxacorys almedinensis A TaxID=2690445 RepID=A0A8J7Z6V1_9CYAN|nr:hypothetical protein [Myxacorys almedinensis]NDJ16575.1 hypothetical protein [Myxacorys almedinensis A]